MDALTDGQTVYCTERRTDRWMGGGADSQTDGQSDGRTVGTTEEQIIDGWRNVTNKAGYSATPVACGWAGAMFEVTTPFGQEQ